MSEDGGSRKISRLKAGLIFFLASTLVSMWGGSFMVSDQLIEKVNPESDRLVPRRRLQVKAQPLAHSKPNRPYVRPEIELNVDEVVNHNPFRVRDDLLMSATKVDPEAAAKEQEAKNQAENKDLELRRTLDRLKSQGVSMVVETTRGRAANIGGKIVHEGDSLDGFIVDQITMDGIILSRERTK